MKLLYSALFVLSFAAATSCSQSGARPYEPSPQCRRQSLPGNCREHAIKMIDQGPLSFTGNDLLTQWGGEQTARLASDEGVLAHLGEPPGQIGTSVLRVDFKPDPHATLRRCTELGSNEALTLVVTGVIVIMLPSGRQLVTSGELGGAPAGGVALMANDGPACTSIPDLTLVKHQAGVEVMCSFGAHPTSHWIEPK